MKSTKISLIFHNSSRLLVQSGSQEDIWVGYEYVDKRKWGSQRMAITYSEGSSAQLKLMSLQPYNLHES